MASQYESPQLKIKALEDQIYAQLIHIKKLEAENKELKLKLVEKNIINYAGEI